MGRDSATSRLPRQVNQNQGGCSFLLLLSAGAHTDAAKNACKWADSSSLSRRFGLGKKSLALGKSVAAYDSRLLSDEETSLWRVTLSALRRCRGGKWTARRSLSVCRGLIDGQTKDCKVGYQIFETGKDWTMRVGILYCIVVRWWLLC